MESRSHFDEDLCDMKMKVVFQIVQHGSLSREVNPWFRPRESRECDMKKNIEI